MNSSSDLDLDRQIIDFLRNDCLALGYAQTFELAELESALSRWIGQPISGAQIIEAVHGTRFLQRTTHGLTNVLPFVLGYTDGVGAAHLSRLQLSDHACRYPSDYGF